LETALNGVILPDRWPKSAIDIVVTVLEAEDDPTWSPSVSSIVGVGTMNVLSSCITVASAALLDAKIDCLDLTTGGVAAAVSSEDGKVMKVLDPSPCDHSDLHSACVVGYMPTRDEITLLWAKGDMPTNSIDKVPGFDSIFESAINAARGSHVVLKQVAAEVSSAQDVYPANKSHT
jgi:exosome complex component MTR3